MVFTLFLEEYKCDMYLTSKTLKCLQRLQVNGVHVKNSLLVSRKCFEKSKNVILKLQYSGFEVFGCCLLTAVNSYFVFILVPQEHITDGLTR